MIGANPVKLKIFAEDLKVVLILLLIKKRTEYSKTKTAWKQRSEIPGRISLSLMLSRIMPTLVI